MRPKNILGRFFGIYSDESKSYVFSYSLRTQNCHNCSICTFQCHALKKGFQNQSFDPKQIPLWFDTAESRAILFPRTQTLQIPCLECSECTVQCPSEIPIHAIAKELWEESRKLAFRSGV